MLLRGVCTFSSSSFPLALYVLQTRALSLVSEGTCVSSWGRQCSTSAPGHAGVLCSVASPLKMFPNGSFTPAFLLLGVGFIPGRVKGF